MITDYLYNLADIINNYHVGNKEFDQYLKQNELELNKLNRLNKLNTLVGAGKELQNSINLLGESIHGLKNDIINKNINLNDLETDQQTINEALDIAMLLIVFLRELYELTNDDKLKQMEKQIQDMIDILNKY
jgi:hypothetical protein